MRAEAAARNESMSNMNMTRMNHNNFQNMNIHSGRGRPYSKPGMNGRGNMSMMGPNGGNLRPPPYPQPNFNFPDQDFYGPMNGYEPMHNSFGPRPFMGNNGMGRGFGRGQGVMPSPFPPQHDGGFPDQPFNTGRNMNMNNNLSNSGNNMHNRMNNNGGMHGNRMNNNNNNNFGGGHPKYYNGDGNGNNNNNNNNR